MFAGIVYGIPFAGFDSCGNSTAGYGNDFTFAEDHYETFIVLSSIILLACVCLLND